MDERTEQKLLEQADRAEILELPHPLRARHGPPRPELARSVYHEGAIDDHVGFVGEVENFLDWAFAYHGGQVRHQHYLTNHHVELDGDEAHAETYFMFIGTERDSAAPLTVFGGRYVDRFARREGRWGIAVRLCLVEWATDPNSLLPAGTTDALATTGTIARNTTDSSYERPLQPRRTAMSG